MNLPNKLSVARVLCIPAIVTLLYFDNRTCRLVAAGLFILGCITDFLDGKHPGCGWGLGIQAGTAGLLRSAE